MNYRTEGPAARAGQFIGWVIATVFGPILGVVYGWFGVVLTVVINGAVWLGAWMAREQAKAKSDG